MGKTVVAAILTEALQADYWKPIQAGIEPTTDTKTVKKLISNPISKFHPETYSLNTPASPHAAAAIDSVEIQMDKFHLPPSENPHLIVEGAGGLHVPLNSQHLVIDLISHLGLEVVLVSQNYLGSINHTLLSIEALKSRGIPTKGIIFNGDETPTTESYILEFAGVAYLGRVPKTREVDQQFILQQAVTFKTILTE